MVSRNSKIVDLVKLLILDNLLSSELFSILNACFILFIDEIINVSWAPILSCRSREIVMRCS